MDNSSFEKPATVESISNPVDTAPLSPPNPGLSQIPPINLDEIRKLARFDYSDLNSPPESQAQLQLVRNQLQQTINSLESTNKPEALTAATQLSFILQGDSYRQTHQLPPVSRQVRIIRKEMTAVIHSQKTDPELITQMNHLQKQPDAIDLATGLKQEWQLMQELRETNPRFTSDYFTLHTRLFSILDGLDSCPITACTEKLAQIQAVADNLEAITPISELRGLTHQMNELKNDVHAIRQQAITRVRNSLNFRAGVIERERQSRPISKDQFEDSKAGIDPLMEIIKAQKRLQTAIGWELAFPDIPTPTPDELARLEDKLNRQLTSVETQYPHDSLAAMSARSTLPARVWKSLLGREAPWVMDKVQAAQSTQASIKLLHQQLRILHNYQLYYEDIIATDEFLLKLQQIGYS